MVPYDEDVNYKEPINKRSSNSDLTILGFRDELVKKHKLDIFEGYNSLGNILFVNSIHKKNRVTKNQLTFLVKRIFKKLKNNIKPYEKDNT